MLNYSGGVGIVGIDMPNYVCMPILWALDKMERRLKKPFSEASDGANNQGTTGAQPATNEVKTKGHIVIPYAQGLCESIKICGKYGIQTYFKGSNNIRKLLVSPRGQRPYGQQK